jgi:hypothetical protein
MFAAALLGLANDAVAQGIFDHGASAPTPGPADISQLTSGSGEPSGLNYYVDTGNPGQTFTTGSNPQGYTLQSLYINEQSGTAGGGMPQLSAYTLRIYEIAETSATLLTTYVSTNEMTFTQGDWIQWTGLTNRFLASAVYGFAISRNGSGWWQLADSSANPYAGGEAATFPTTTGTVNFGSSSNYDAAFDLGLLPFTDPLVTPTTILPANPVYAGTLVTLSASVSGTAPFTSFIWQSDGGSDGATWSDLSASTTNSYSLNTTGMAAGDTEYRLIVTGGAGTTTNVPATLVLSNASAPFVAANTTVTPSTIYVGGSVTISATFGGTLPITYQWQFTGTNNVTVDIPGATNRVYTITSAQYINAGSYSLVASNSVAGGSASTAATLSVTAPVLISISATAPTPGPYDIAQLSTSGSTGDPDPPINNYYDNNSEPCGQTFTTLDNSSGYVLNALYINYGNGNHSSGTAYTLRLYSLSDNTATLLSTYQNDNTAAAIANGDWTEWSGLTNILQPNTLYAYTLNAGSGYDQMGCASANPYAGGQIVEIPGAGGAVTYGAAGTYDATFDVNLVPLGFPAVETVSISPANSSANPIYGGTAVTLSVSAIGSSPLGYVWQTDNGSGGITWSNLPNSDTDSYLVDTTSLSAGAYEYQVVVTNSLSTATSSIVTLNLVPPSGPVLLSGTTITPPVTTVGNAVSIGATFNGTPPIFYQWYFNNGSGTVSIAGATNDTFSIASAQTANSGSYSVIASNAVGGSSTASSTLANLLVTQPGQTNVSSAAFLDAGANAPNPGVDDISQLISTVPSIVPGLNYYVNNSAPPGQTFTTGSNPPTLAGYPLTSLFIKEEVNTVGSGGGTAQFYTLKIYSVSSNDASLLTAYTSTNTLAITEGDWMVWTGMTNFLQPNTTYAFSINNDYNIYGWWKPANDGGDETDLYTNGQAALLPASGYGGITFSTDPTIDAAFLVGLTPASGPKIVENTTITPAMCYAGNPVTMQALFTGSTPIAYQWQFTDTNGVGPVDILGATNSTYTITSMNPTNAGVYSLVASNDFNGVPNVLASTPASLSLVPAPTNFVANFAYSTAGPTSYSGPGVFPSGTYWNTIANTTGGTENAYADDGFTDLYIGFASTRTWDFANSGGGIGLLEYYMLNQSTTPTTFGLYNLPQGVYNLYVYSCDGHYQKSQTIFTIDGVSQTATTTTDASFIQSNNYVFFTNLIVTNGAINGTWLEGSAEGALNGLQVQLAYSFANPALYIAEQPSNAVVALGQPAGFNVLAFGPPPLFYQWQTNGQAIPSATNSALNFAATTVADGIPNYSVVVSNLSGMVVTSSVANLVVRTSVNDLLWQAYETSSWDLSTANWEDTNSLNEVSFQQGDNVTFDGTAYGFTVAFSQMLMPSSVAVNSPLAYTFQGPGYLSWTMNLNLLGSSALILETVNNYTGNTILSPGSTLSLSGAGSIGSSIAIALGSGATLSATGRSDATFTVNPSQTLEGNGAFNVNGTVVNNGTLAFKVNKTGGVITNDLLQGVTSIVYGGTLELFLAGQALTVADTITLFSATNYSGVFANVTPSIPGSGLVWDTNTLTTDGTLRIASGVNTIPTNIIVTVSGNVLQLSWPADHTGWRLLVQTNNLAEGISLNTNDWMTVPGSTEVDQTNITIEPTNKTEFYKLAYP